MKLIEYFDRISVIHLPERIDRYIGLARDLRRMQIEIADPKVQIPLAPRPESAHGFPSKGVYGNFLSHHAILKKAMDEGLNSVLVLEDDAIFSRRFAQRQDELASQLDATKWDLCYFGHTLKKELRGAPPGLVQCTLPFRWAHCYAAHRRVMSRLVAYLEEAMIRPAGDPIGGRLYIDGAFNLFRHHNPEVVSLVANPNLSRQKGCPSNLAKGKWYDRVPLPLPIVAHARAARDELWRWTNLP